MSNKLYCCEIDKTTYFNDQQPEGFQQWAEGITHKECIFILPDNTTYDIKPFVDHQGQFNKYSYTNFILRRYDDL
jgi:hypothetical protein